MLIAIEDVVNETIDDRGLADSLIAQEYDFIFEEWGDSSLRQVQIAYICHFCLNII